MQTVLAVIKPASSLKTILDAVSSMVDTVSIDFKKEGMMLQAMDSSHVSLCFLVLESKGFHAYTCDKNISVGLNLVHASKIMRCASNEDSVTLKVGDNEDVLEIDIDGKDRKSCFVLRLMDVDQERLDIPPVEYPFSFTTKSSDLQKTVRDLLIVGENCRVSVSREVVTLSACGDMGKACMKLDVDVDVDESAEHNGVLMDFALRYMSLFTKASSLSEHVKVMVSDNAPMCLEYDMGDMGSLKYFLAPKIEDDD